MVAFLPRHPDAGSVGSKLLNEEPWQAATVTREDAAVRRVGKTLPNIGSGPAWRRGPSITRLVRTSPSRRASASTWVITWTKPFGEAALRFERLGLIPARCRDEPLCVGASFASELLAQPIFLGSISFSYARFSYRRPSTLLEADLHAGYNNISFRRRASFLNHKAARWCTGGRPVSFVVEFTRELHLFDKPMRRRPLVPMRDDLGPRPVVRGESRLVGSLAIQSVMGPAASVVHIRPASLAESRGNRPSDGDFGSRPLPRPYDARFGAFPTTAISDLRPMEIARTGRVVSDRLPGVADVGPKVR